MKRNAKPLKNRKGATFLYIFPFWNLTFRFSAQICWSGRFYYVPDEDALQINRILHGRRDTERVLER